MSETSFRLREKTVVLAGPFGTITQSVANTLTVHGSDVGMIGPGLSKARRFAESLTDQREVHAHYGRAMTLDTEIVDQKSATEAVSRVAETFGSADVYIDLHLASQPILEGFNKTAVEDWIHPVQHLITGAMPFFEGRQKGRVIIVSHHPKLLGEINKENSEKVHNWVTESIQSLAKKNVDANITVNALNVGITEEYLLSICSSGDALKDTLKRLQEKWPLARLVDPAEVAEALAFFSSPLSSGISGQRLNITKTLF